MTKLKKFFAWLGDILDDVFAYVLTVVGILFSNAVPMLKANEPIVLDFGLLRIVVAMIVALLFVSDQETLGKIEGETKTVAKQGRRKNFRKRMTNALAQGVMWAQIMNMVG